MQYVAESYKGLGLLFDVNNDRMISILMIIVALAVVGWVGVEYANSVIVQDQAPMMASFL